MTPESLYARFGPNAFEPGLFYANAPALRFELSRSGRAVNLFIQAFDRAREILEPVFAASDRLLVVLALPSDGPLPRSLDVFRSLRRCGIRLSTPRTAWTRSIDEGDGEAEQERLVAFHAPADALLPLLWGALARDLGIEPAIRARLYLAEPALGIVVYPYDDRGMDVIGPNAAVLFDLYTRHNAYLLDYDRARMQGFFGRDGAPGVPEGTPLSE